jgi:PAS domain S-box-containing protein
MHDAHRSKPELIHEITGLRKQVVDLKAAMTARRRVEDALRETETTLRRLSDGAPVGLCLFDLKGTLLAANRRFALMLGYDSAADLLSIAGVLGVFANPEEQSLALNASGDMRSFPHRALFRLKSGCRQQHLVLASRCADPEHGAIALAVLDSDPALISPPFQSPSA